MSSLPEDIYLDILLRLSVKTACVCKCVCKTWFSIISNPSFAKSHLNITIQNENFNLMVGNSRNCYEIYSIGHDSLPSILSSERSFLEYAVELDYPFKPFTHIYDLVHLVGFCDGLVCLSFELVDVQKECLCLWNPATREYKKLPKSPFFMNDCMMIGLGYDCTSEDYKLVACSIHGSFEVYSLGSNSWTRIGNVPYKFNGVFDGEPEVGVLVNRNRLHWLVKAQDSSQVIVSLDMGDQIFKEIQLPNELLVMKTDRDMELGVLEGCLCVHVVVAHIYDQVYSEVWVMQSHGVQESWTKRYELIDHRRIVTASLPSLMWSFKSGELLFRHYGSDLVIYDPKDKSVRESNIPYSTRVDRQGCYYESLVSLGSGTYVWEQKKKKKPRKKGVITRAWFRSSLVLNYVGAKKKKKMKNP